MNLERMDFNFINLILLFNGNGMIGIMVMVSLRDVMFGYLMGMVFMGFWEFFVFVLLLDFGGLMGYNMFLSMLLYMLLFYYFLYI